MRAVALKSSQGGEPALTCGIMDVTDGESARRPAKQEAGEKRRPRLPVEPCVEDNRAPAVDTVNRAD